MHPTGFKPVSADLSQIFVSCGPSRGLHVCDVQALMSRASTMATCLDEAMISE